MWFPVSKESMIRLAVALSLIIAFTGCRSREIAPSQAQPGAKQASGPAPGALFPSKPLHQPPSLEGTGQAAVASVDKFIAWAAASTPSEREDGRRSIHAAHDNAEVAKALVEEAKAVRVRDPSRALVVLGILGEQRHALGEAFFRELLGEPFPKAGQQTAEGEVMEQTTVGILQAKAVDGLAYMRNPAADEEVLRVAAAHPSRIVRAEAIAAYLWNHPDSPQARAVLSKRLRRDELVFMDRVTRQEGETARSFNTKLASFLRAHPEVTPPVPKRLEKPNPPKADGSPPSWSGSEKKKEAP